MSKYHISKSGKPTKCRAFINACPLGQHYGTKEEAYEKIQSQMSDEYGILSKNQDEINLKKEYDKQYRLIKAGKFKSRKDEELERTKLSKFAKRIKGNDSEVENLRDLLKDLKSPDGGATMSISFNSKEKAIVPTVGFCASPYPEYSKVLNSVKEVNHLTLLKYMDSLDGRGQDILLEKDVYIGLWNDPNSGKIYLDISKRYITSEDARIACEQNDQIAYFDLQMLESVEVNSKAKSGQTL